MEAGITLPLIIVAQDNRLIDGFHRHKAHLLDRKDQAMEIERWHYDDEVEMVVDAAKRNTAHGLPLTPKDRVHVTLKLRKMKAPLPVIAEALGMSKKNLDFLMQRRTATTQSGEKIAIARGAEALSDSKRSTKRLTKEQEHFARTANGVLPIINIHLLLNALRALNPCDCPDHEFDKLLELRMEIDRWENERRAAA